MLESEKKKIRKMIESGKIYFEKRYVAWRKRIFKRDGYRCQFNDCKRMGTLNAHHIKMKWYHPELIYKARNGITLCKYHHTYVHRQGSDNYIERFEKVAEENAKKPKISLKHVKPRGKKKKKKASKKTSKKTYKKVKRYRKKAPR